MQSRYKYNVQPVKLLWETGNRVHENRFSCQGLDYLCRSYHKATYSPLRRWGEWRQDGSHSHVIVHPNIDTLPER
eukprot:6189913-Pleurochrysis_carterae.AAC.1